jgi:hypothetical protein
MQFTFVYISELIIICIAIFLVLLLFFILGKAFCCDKITQEEEIHLVEIIQLHSQSESENEMVCVENKYGKDVL